MPSSTSRSSVLHHFAAVPHRAFCDKRLKARHHRVLGAICIAIDPMTGHSCISQERISERAALSRQRVTNVVRDLERWGYIQRVNRGRRKCGQFKVLIYTILYDAPPATRAPSRGDTDRDTHVGDTAVSPPEAADSDSLSPDIQNCSDSAEPDVQHAGPWRTRRASALSDNPQPIGWQATIHAISKPAPDANRRNKSVVTDVSMQKAMAVSKAEALEKDTRNAAETRIWKGLFEAFPGDERAKAVAAVPEEQYQLAVDAEAQQPGAGVSMVVGAVKRALKTAKRSR